MMTERALSNRTASSSAVMLRTRPLGLRRRPAVLRLDLAERPEQHVHRRAVHGPAHEQRQQEARSAVERAGDDLDLVHQHEAHGRVGQAGVGVEQGDDHRHVRRADGNDQQEAEQQGQGDHEEEQRAGRRHDDQVDEACRP